MSAMQVVTDAVAEAGVRISAGADAVDAVADAPAVLALAPSPLEDGLARALAGFAAAWSQECRHLAQEVRTLADATTLAAAAYRDAEWARTERTDALALRLLTGPGGA